jgi:N-formylglutamate amidohydrolase
VPEFVPEDAFPIVKRPAAVPEVPVLVSVPHYGTDAIPGIGPDDYVDPAHVTLPWGYADTFAADIYGDAHATGAWVIATPYSRLFVDVNRRRDDFTCEGEVVKSHRGVFRTHTIRDIAIFSRPLRPADAEAILDRFYDPYHTALGGLIDDIGGRHGRVFLVDAHTGSPLRMGDHEVVVGTRRGATAPRRQIDQIKAVIADAGFEVHEDVPGYAGGHIVRRYGEDGNPDVDAVQIEFNAGLLMTTPRDELIPRMKRGERPARHEANIERARRCVEAIIAVVAA